ncbi:MAG: DUF885 domain-containing protein [Fimbriimonadaceae bacterium]|jgi:hypothetical protein|nr:DUF885 domain-containing protein [Fimbriimonadaceae bacterium]
MSWPDLLHEFAADEKDLARRFPLAFSIDANSFRIDWLDEWETRCANTPTASLEDRLDQRLFSRVIQARRRDLANLVSEEPERIDWIPGYLPLTYLVSMDRRLPKGSPRDWANHLQAALDSFESHPEPTDKSWLALAANTLKSLLDEFESWVKFHDGSDPEFHFHCATVAGQVQVELQKKLEKFKSLESQGLDPLTLIPPVGEQRLIQDLKREEISTPLTRLLETALREKTWCEGMIDQACAALGFGTRHEALEATKERTAQIGHQARVSCKMAREAIQWLKDRDLITIPPLAEETWTVTMLDEEQQKVSPFYLGGPTLYVSSPTWRMTPREAEMSRRSNNLAFSRAVVQHELIPGHAMQAFMNQRHKTHRRVFETPFWTEGWTLHWEMLLFEQGFYRDATDVIGMMFWRLHRAVRVLFSLRYHLGEISAQDCVEMLVTEVGHELSTAEAEVRRSFNGEWPPLYQAAYLLGGIQMHNLSEEWVLAGRSLKDFHDFVMHQNQMPVECLAVLARGDEAIQIPLLEREPGYWGLSKLELPSGSAHF